MKRISYYSKITKKPKFKQVQIKKYESEEDAQQFLENWKAEQIENERKILENKPIVEEKTILNEEKQLVEEIKNEIINDIVQGEYNYLGDTILSELPEIVYSPFKINQPNLKESGGGKTIAIIAASQSGKTTLTNYITRTYLDKPKDSVCVYMSSTLAHDIYKPIKKNKNIISMDFFNESMIKDVGKIQKRTDNKYKGFAIVLDDLIGNSIKNSDELMQLILTYRNLNISTLLNSQDCKLVARHLRHNVNNAYFLRQNYPDSIKDILDLFIGSYPPFAGLTLDQKTALYMKATENNGIIYLDAIHNKLYFHKAVPKK